MTLPISERPQDDVVVEIVGTVPRSSIVVGTIFGFIMIVYCAPQLLVATDTTVRLVLWIVLLLGIIGLGGGIAGLAARRLPQFSVWVGKDNVRWRTSHAIEHIVSFQEVTEIAYNFWDPTFATIEFRMRSGRAVRLISRWLDENALESLLALLRERVRAPIVKM